MKNITLTTLTFLSLIVAVRATCFADCSVIAGSHCALRSTGESYCACDNTAWFVNPAGNACAPLVKCTPDFQCRVNAHCSEDVGQCVCNDGYVPVLKRTGVLCMLAPSSTTSQAPSSTTSAAPSSTTSSAAPSSTTSAAPSSTSPSSSPPVISTVNNEEPSSTSSSSSTSSTSSSSSSTPVASSSRPGDHTCGANDCPVNSHCDTGCCLCDRGYVEQGTYQGMAKYGNTGNHHTSQFPYMEDVICVYDNETDTSNHAGKDSGSKAKSGKGKSDAGKAKGNSGKDGSKDVHPSSASSQNSAQGASGSVSNSGSPSGSSSTPAVPSSSAQSAGKNAGKDAGKDAGKGAKGGKRYI